MRRLLLPISALLTIIFTVALTIAPLFARDMLEFAYRAPNQRFVVHDVLSGNSYSLPNGVYDLNWSPDGGVVAVTHQSAPAELRLITYPASTFRRVPRATSGAVAWSPDGAYYATVTSRGHVTITHVPTGQSVNHTISLAFWNASWSTHSDEIAMATLNHELQIFDLHSATRETLIRYESGEVNEVVWSPTDDRLAYTLTTNEYLRHLYIIDRHTGEIDRDYVVSASQFAPRWSADGRYLSYLVDDDGWQIDVIDTQTGDVWRATTTPLPFGSPPIWSGDSRFIAYLDPSTGVTLIDVTTDARYVYDQAGENVAGFTLSPDGQYVALRVIGFNENYVVLIHIESGERDLFPVSSSSSETWRPLPR